jgi:mannobiose 2-epimerase
MQITMKTAFLILSLLMSVISTAQTKRGLATKEDRLTIANEMENSIRNELLNKWYPQSVDSTYGGFLSTYTYDFKPTGPQDKFIVTQARHTWSTAKAAERYPGKKYYIKCSEIGFRF